MKLNYICASAWAEQTAGNFVISSESKAKEAMFLFHRDGIDLPFKDMKHMFSLTNIFVLL